MLAVGLFGLLRFLGAVPEGLAGALRFLLAGAAAAAAGFAAADALRFLLAGSLVLVAVVVRACASS